MKTYSEALKYKTFEERLEYLKLSGQIGNPTFGFDRYLNQMFYASQEWKNTRSKVIARDEGNDLGVPDCPIAGKIYVHHIDPISAEDIKNSSPKLFSLENLISCSKLTHDIITYGLDTENKSYSIEDRQAGDTKLW